MTNQEFSDEFDVLYNNIMSNQAPGLDEYEKSVFLTKALDEIIKSYFLALYNKGQLGFDDNERRQIDFSMLIKNVEPNEAFFDGEPTVVNSKFYTIPRNILMYINEFATVTRGGLTKKLTVISLSYNELTRLMSKPYKRPLKHLAWRLIYSGYTEGFYTTYYERIAEVISELSACKSAGGTAEKIYNTIKNQVLTINENYLLVGDQGNYLAANGSTVSSPTSALDISSTASSISSLIHVRVSDASDTKVEVIPGHNDVVTKYIVRYVARPRPIVLTDLTNEGVSVGGETAETSCELDPILHQEILQRAVELAKAAYQGDLTSTVKIGNLSSTEKGVVTQQ